MKLLQKNLLEEIAHYYALAFAIDLLTSFNGQAISYDGAGNPTTKHPRPCLLKDYIGDGEIK